MVASIVIRSIIDNRTGVSRGKLGNLGGFCGDFWRKDVFGGEFNAEAQGAQRDARGHITRGSGYLAVETVLWRAPTLEQV